MDEFLQRVDPNKPSHKRLIAWGISVAVFVAILGIVSIYAPFLGTRFVSIRSFYITGPSTLVAGKSAVITWYASAENRKRYPSEKIEFCRSKIFGKSCITLLANTPNDGEATVKVPNLKPGPGYVRITARRITKRLLLPNISSTKQVMVKVPPPNTPTPSPEDTNSSPDNSSPPATSTTPVVTSTPSGLPKQTPQASLQDRLFYNFHYGRTLRNPSEFSNHKLLDAVFLEARWPELEPQKGNFNFTELDKRIAIWNAAGKRIVLRITPYGHTRGNDATPTWVYETVPKIEFDNAKRGHATIPKVWDDRFLQEYSAYLAKVAEHYNSDSRVQYIAIGIGHLGHTTAQPDKEGTAAFLQAGWTIDAWESYMKKIIDVNNRLFVNKQLMMSISPDFLRKISLAQNIETGKRTAEYAARLGFYINLIGVDVSPTVFSDRGYTVIIDHVLSKGISRVTFGMGDDWPLYGQTGSIFRTPNDFGQILNNIKNIWTARNKSFQVYLIVLDDEMAASDVSSTKFNQAVHDSLKNFLSAIGS